MDALVTATAAKLVVSAAIEEIVTVPATHREAIVRNPRRDRIGHLVTAPRVGTIATVARRRMRDATQPRSIRVRRQRKLSRHQDIKPLRNHALRLPMQARREAIVRRVRKVLQPMDHAVVAAAVAAVAAEVAVKKVRAEALKAASRRTRCPTITQRDHRKVAVIM